MARKYVACTHARPPMPSHASAGSSFLRTRSWSRLATASQPASSAKLTALRISERWNGETPSSISSRANEPLSAHMAAATAASA